MISLLHGVCNLVSNGFTSFQRTQTRKILSCGCIDRVYLFIVSQIMKKVNSWWAKNGILGKIIDFLGDCLENLGESRFFFGGKFAKDKVDIAEFLADFGIIGAEAQPRKILCA